MERPAVYIASDVIESERSGRGKCERESERAKRRGEKERGREKERGTPRENVSWWLPTCTPLPLSPVVTFLANAV